MALYRQQSPFNAALQGLQGAASTSASMTKKQEVKEGKKSFGGALGSMVAGGTLGLGAADMFTGSEATRAMWTGLKGALGGTEAAAAGAAGTANLATGAGAALTPVAASMATPIATAAGTTALPVGVANFSTGMGAIEGAGAALASGGELTAELAAGAEIAGGLSPVAPAAGSAGPIGWGLLGAGALLGLASYYL